MAKMDIYNTNGDVVNAIEFEDGLDIAAFMLDVYGEKYINHQHYTGFYDFIEIVFKSEETEHIVRFDEINHDFIYWKNQITMLHDIIESVKAN